jgi:hypothetical protein
MKYLVLYKKVVERGEFFVSDLGHPHPLPISKPYTHNLGNAIAAML